MGVNQSKKVTGDNEASKNALRDKANALNGKLNKCELFKTETLNIFAQVLQKFFDGAKGNIPTVLTRISPEIHSIQDQLVKQKIIEQNWLNKKIKDENFEKRVMTYLMEGGPLSPFLKEDIDKIFLDDATESQAGGGGHEPPSAPGAPAPAPAPGAPAPAPADPNAPPAMSPEMEAIVTPPKPTDPLQGVVNQGKGVGKIAEGIAKIIYQLYDKPEVELDDRKLFEEFIAPEKQKIGDGVGAIAKNTPTALQAKAVQDGMEFAATAPLRAADQQAKEARAAAIGAVAIPGAPPVPAVNAPPPIPGLTQNPEPAPNAAKGQNRPVPSQKQEGGKTEAEIAAEKSAAETSAAEKSAADTKTETAEKSAAETSGAETKTAETSGAETSGAETSAAETSEKTTDTTAAPASEAAPGAEAADEYTSMYGKIAINPKPSPEDSNKLLQKIIERYIYALRYRACFEVLEYIIDSKPLKFEYKKTQIADTKKDIKNKKTTLGEATKPAEGEENPAAEGEENATQAGGQKKRGKKRSKAKQAQAKQAQAKQAQAKQAQAKQAQAKHAQAKQAQANENQAENAQAQIGGKPNFMKSTVEKESTKFKDIKKAEFDKQKKAFMGDMPKVIKFLDDNMTTILPIWQRELTPGNPNIIGNKIDGNYMKPGDSRPTGIVKTVLKTVLEYKAEPETRGYAFTVGQCTKEEGEGKTEENTDAATEVKPEKEGENKEVKPAVKEGVTTEGVTKEGAKEEATKE